MNVLVKLAVVAFSLSCSAWAGAQAQSADDCLKVEESDARLSCYDKLLGFQPKESPKPADRPAVKWKIRDSGTVSPIGFADVGTKPGLLQVGRSDGKDFSTAKVAVVGVIRAIDQPNGFFDGWEPFLGASWDRDTSAKTPKDLRQVLVGISGQIGSPKPDGVSAFPTVRLGYKDDSKANARGAFLNTHVDVIYLPWVNSSEGAGINSWAFVPYLGLYAESAHAAPAATQDGSFVGSYAGGKLEYKLGVIAERLSVTGQGQYYRDFRAPVNVGKRVHRFASLGIKYDLVDPKTKSGWVPSVSLSWQRGTEPVTGEGPSRKTVLGFGVKFD